MGKKRRNHKSARTTDSDQQRRHKDRGRPAEKERFGSTTLGAALGGLIGDIKKAIAKKPPSKPTTKDADVKVVREPLPKKKAPRIRPVEAVKKATAAPLPTIAPRPLRVLDVRPTAPTPTEPRKKGHQVSTALEGSKQEVAIGLDVGTSCIKVVIRDISTRESYAVPIGKLCSSAHPYLLATAVSLSKSGVFRLGHAGRSSHDPKMDFFLMGDELVPEQDGFPTHSPLEVFVALIAIVLAESRDWFLRANHDRYQGVSVIWHLNIGIPSNVLDASALRDGFRLAAMAGWSLSCVSREPSLKEVRQAISTARKAMASEEGAAQFYESSGIVPEMVYALPEVVAEVQGYRASSLRRPGLHFLIDIGASTVDLVTFNLLESRDGDRFPVLATSVYTMGMLRLNEDRADAVAAEMRLRGRSDAETRGWQHESRQRMLDGMKAARVAAELDADLLTAIRAVDDKYVSQLRSAMSEILIVTKRDRDSRAAEWKDGLPIFCCGGGSADPVVDEAIDKFDKSFWSDGRQLFVRSPLVRPEEFNAPGLMPQDYHRLAVADGLAYRVVDLPEIVEPGNIPNVDVTGATIDISERFIGAEQT